MITDYTYNAQFIKYPNPKEFKIERKEAIEIKMNEEIIFDNDKKFFKFEYINDTDEEQTLYLSFNSEEDFDIILYLPESDKIERIPYYDRWARWDNGYSFILTNQGIYYIEFDGRIDSDKSVNTFSIFISGKILDTIDLNQKMYYKNLKFETSYKLNPSLIKVNNLIDDRYVFFTYKILDSYYDATHFNNPYTICNDNTEECSYDVKTYKFLKNNNYTIYLSFVSEINNSEKYYFPSYIFFPIFEDTIEEKEEGFYSFTEPKIYTIHLEELKDLCVLFINTDKVYSTINEDFSLENLKDYSFQEIRNYDYYYGNYVNYGYNYIILIILPEIGEYLTQFIIANNELMLSNPGDYTIPAGKNTIIYFDISRYENNLLYNSNYKQNLEEEEEEMDYINPLSFYNTIVTFSSPIENMILFSGYETKKKIL